MATGFRLEVAYPSTNIKTAFSKAYTHDDQAVQRIECELKKEKGRISTMTVDLFDKNWDTFNDVPDIAFFDIPIKLYVAPPGNPNSISSLVFDGMLAAYDAETGGGLSHLQLVAHDYSFKARVSALSRTFTNKTSVDFCKTIAASYGWTVDASSLGTVQLKQRSISFGLSLSDWDHLQRELYADGLTAHMKGKKLIIHQAPTVKYPTTFRPGDGIFRKLQVRINHVRGPGKLGNTTVPLPLENGGTQQALQGTAIAEAQKIQGGDRHTHRRPVGGPASTTKGAHTEDTDGSNWKNRVDLLRARKDEATLTIAPTPDLFLTHLVQLGAVPPQQTGFLGPKADGLWQPTSIKHLIVSGGGGSMTEVALVRPASKQAAKQAGSPPPLDYNQAAELSSEINAQLAQITAAANAAAGIK